MNTQPRMTAYETTASLGIDPHAAIRALRLTYGASGVVVAEDGKQIYFADAQRAQLELERLHGNGVNAVGLNLAHVAPWVLHENDTPSTTQPLYCHVKDKRPR